MLSFYKFVVAKLLNIIILYKFFYNYLRKKIRTDVKASRNLARTLKGAVEASRNLARGLKGAVKAPFKIYSIKIN